MFLVVIEKEIAGFISVADPIKESSASAIKHLQEQGLEVMMLTGDSIRTLPKRLLTSLD